MLPHFSALFRQQHKMARLNQIKISIPLATNGYRFLPPPAPGVLPFLLSPIISHCDCFENPSSLSFASHPLLPSPILPDFHPPRYHGLSTYLTLQCHLSLGIRIVTFLDISWSIPLPPTAATHPQYHGLSTPLIFAFFPPLVALELSPPIAHPCRLRRQPSCCIRVVTLLPSCLSLRCHPSCRVVTFLPSCLYLCCHPSCLCGGFCW